jgi:hypothetical protein
VADIRRFHRLGAGLMPVPASGFRVKNEQINCLPLTSNGTFTLMTSFIPVFALMDSVRRLREATKFTKATASISRR